MGERTNNPVFVQRRTIFLEAVKPSIQIDEIDGQRETVGQEERVRTAIRWSNPFVSGDSFEVCR